MNPKFIDRTNVQIPLSWSGRCRCFQRGSFTGKCDGPLSHPRARIAGSDADRAGEKDSVGAALMTENSVEMKVVGARSCRGLPGSSGMKRISEAASASAAWLHRLDFVAIARIGLRHPKGKWRVSQTLGRVSLEATIRSDVTAAKIPVLAT